MSYPNPPSRFRPGPADPFVVMRRNLLIAVAVMAVAATARFLIPNVSDRGAATVRAVAADQVPVGAAVLISAGQAYLLHDAGGFYAMTAQAGAGCSELLRWDAASRRLVNPCTQAAYDERGLRLDASGRVDPNGDALRHFRVLRNSDGVLLIDELDSESVNWRLKP